MLLVNSVMLCVLEGESPVLCLVRVATVLSKAYSKQSKVIPLYAGKARASVFLITLAKQCSLSPAGAAVQVKNVRDNRPMRGVILTEHAKSIIWRIMRDNNMDLEPQTKPKVTTSPVEHAVGLTTCLSLSAHLIVSVGSASFEG